MIHCHARHHEMHMLITVKTHVLGGNILVSAPISSINLDHPCLRVQFMDKLHDLPPPLLNLEGTLHDEQWRHNIQ